MKMLCASITDNCNLRCKYCPMKEWRGIGRFIDTHDFLNFVTESAADYIVEITGGEPSLHPDFEKMRDYLAEQERMVIIRTNNKDIRAKKNEIVLWAMHGRYNVEPRATSIPLVFSLKEFEYWRKKKRFVVAEPFKWEHNVDENGVWHDYKDGEEGHPPYAEMDLVGTTLFLVPEGFVRMCSASQKNICNLNEKMDASFVSTPPCKICGSWNMIKHLWKNVDKIQVSKRIFGNFIDR